MSVARPVSDIIVVSNEAKEVELIVTQGVTFRPFTIEYTNPDGTAFDFTGATIVAEIFRKQGGEKVGAIDNVITGNVVAYSLPAGFFKDLQIGGNLNDSRSSFFWRSTIEWGDGTRDSYIKGPIFVDPY